MTFKTKGLHFFVFEIGTTLMFADIDTSNDVELTNGTAMNERLTGDVRMPASTFVAISGMVFQPFNYQCPRTQKRFEKNARRPTRARYVA